MTVTISDYFKSMGKKGGKTTALRGSAYYSEIAKKSWEIRRAKKEAELGVDKSESKPFLG